jgi:hypothetical protein
MKIQRARALLFLPIPHNNTCAPQTHTICMLLCSFSVYALALHLIYFPSQRTHIVFPKMRDTSNFSLSLLCVYMFSFSLSSLACALSLCYFVDTLPHFPVFPGNTSHGLQKFVEVTMQITFLCPTQLPTVFLVLPRTRTAMCRQHLRPVQRRHRLKKVGNLGSINPEDLRCWVRLTSKTQECCGSKHFGGQHRRPKGGRRCRRRCRSKAQTRKRRSPSA